MSKKLQYFKATRPNGRDFYTGTVDYGAALVSGETITHPTARMDQVSGRASTYLSISTSAADCAGFSWPCRLFVVESVGRALKADDTLPNKRRVSGLRVVAELPAHEVFGPNGAKVAALIERAGRLTRDEVNRLDAARDAAWCAARYAARDAARCAARYAARDAARHAARDAARYAARDAARDAARYAAWYAARYAAWDAAWYAARYAARYAALALVVQDLITEEYFNTLYGPWASVIGDAS